MSDEKPVNPELEKIRQMYRDARDKWTIQTARSMNLMAEEAMKIRALLGELTWEECWEEWVRRVGALIVLQPETPVLERSAVSQLNDDPGPTREGILPAAIRINKRGEVLVTFGESVKWLAMQPDAALTFARLLANAAMRAGEPPRDPGAVN